MSAGMSSSTDGFRLTSGLLDMNAAYTFMCWVRLSADTNNYVCVFALSYNDSQYDFIGTWADGTTLLAEIANAGVWDDIGAANLGDLAWHHVALVRESATVARLYCDGVLDGTSTNSVTSRTAAAYIDVGSWAISSSNFLTGDVCAIKAWSAALTEAEIQAEMQTIAPRRAADVYAFWPVFPGSGERTRDYGGSGHDWTESGTIDDNAPPPVSWGAGAWLLSHIAAGGTLYSQSVAGSIANAGAVARQTARGLAGSIASAGTIVRQTAHVLAGALTSAGVLVPVRTILQVVGGSIASAGVMAKQTARGLVGALTSAGAVARRAALSAGGGIALSGAVGRATGRILSSTLAGAGGLARGTLKALAGTLASSGAESSSTGGGSVSLAGAISLAGALVKQVNHVIRDTEGFKWFYRRYVLRRRE